MPDLKVEAAARRLRIISLSWHGIVLVPFLKMKDCQNRPMLFNQTLKLCALQS